MKLPGNHQLCLLAALAVTAVVYWPGLSGGYLFDDFPNITDNPDVHVSTSSWKDWQQAALASPSQDLRRPLSMLSFAANYYFTGLDPLPMKLTNLGIHLVNGILLYGLLLALLQLWNRRRPLPLPDSSIRWMSIGLSSAWLLAPINLSSVLYVVQRMECLAQTFVLAGLWLYLVGRKRMLDGESRHGASIAASGLASGLIIGMLCKESAALLPGYAFLIELTILQFDARHPAERRKLWFIFSFLLFVPAAIGLIWLLPRALSPLAYSTRPFTLGQRLLTETRVLVEYSVWTLLPRPDALSFYHDDIRLSQGWLSPLSTLGCTLLLIAGAAMAALSRRRLPLLALGIGWYFAAHLLTATIIPLELVFEHRNYFASIGLLMAAGSLLIEIPAAHSAIQRTLVVAWLTLFSVTTALRAHEWSNPIQFAYAEAASHPGSPRANYELGRVLTITSGYRTESKLIDPALRAFTAAAELPDAGAAPWAAMIVVASHASRKVKAQWWHELEARLHAHPPSIEEIGALASLANCEHSSTCAADDAPLLLAAFLAALDHPRTDSKLLATYGAFVANQLGDYVLATDMLREAIKQSPHSFGYRMELANVLVLRGARGEAEELLKGIAAEDLSPQERDQVKTLQKTLDTGLPPVKNPGA